MPIVFISYSHDSDDHKEKVLALSERLRADGIETRLDQYVNGTPKEGWPLWMLNRLDEAQFVLVICTEVYYRRFRRKEEPGKGKGVRWEGALITQDIYDDENIAVKYVPILFSDDQQPFIPNPIRPMSRYALNSETHYQSLLDFLYGRAGVEPGEVSEPEHRERAKGQPLTFGDTPTPISQLPSPNPSLIEIARLPQLLTRDLFGRDAELKLLDDAWANPATNIVVFAAFGGTGKSALVNNWVRRIAQENYCGAARVYAWSFWSQGSDQPQTSADPFIDAALRWFGDSDPAAGLPWDKGERLARYIKQTRTLLILDGLEPLQHPPGPMEGQLKEQTMQALLRELAAGQPGLCVISTREPIADLLDYAEPAVVSRDLEQLSPQAGAQILRQQQIEGDDAELEQASADFGNHALALTILSSLLKDAYGGDIRRRREIPALRDSEGRKGRHALRVMASYERWLSEAGEHTMLAVLRLLGLFNRPASATSIAALRAEPAILGLTDTLQGVNKTQWEMTLSKLRRIKLLTANMVISSSAPESLDAHPLVREHFGHQMKRDHPNTWREANLRLYEHLTATTKEFPDTAEEMAPLFAAVTHGCEAERHQQAADVYWRRIQRGNENFNWHKLGLFGADLAALAGFFETRWREPVAGLNEAAQTFVLRAAGFDLRALGRLQEAAEPFQIVLQANISQGKWIDAAIVADSLSDLYLMIGELPQALKFARQSVDMADRSGSQFQRITKRTTMANALHQANQLEEAEATFYQAEDMQKLLQPVTPILYGVWGFRYCDLLLGHGMHQEVKERVTRTIKWGKQYGGLLIKALDNLLLGRACLLQSRQSGSNYGQAAEFLQQSVDELRQAGQIQELPRGLLARAEMYRLMGDRLSFERAQTDLAEAQRIAERGSMGLHLADCHLERARLRLAQGDRDNAREHWEKAKAMIERMGYHRRDKDVAEIEEQLKAN